MIEVIFALIAAMPTRAFDLPKGLTKSDRVEIVQTLGLSSSEKLLTNPYPLGGYSGVELGVSVEYINVRDIRRLGCSPGSSGCPNSSISDETEWRYSRLSIGKGLYDNVDIFFSFIPPVGSSKISDYGGFARWSFYQAQFLPVNVSLIGYYNQLNFADTFSNRNVGADMIVGVNVDNFSLYFGGGTLSAKGTFTGANNDSTCQEDCTVSPGDDAVDSYTQTVSESVQESHIVIGLSLHYDNLFASAQVDRYNDAVYSLKTGLRF